MKQLNATDGGAIGAVGPDSRDGAKYEVPEVE